MIKRILMLFLLTSGASYGDGVILHLHAYHPTVDYLNNNVYGIGYKKDDNIIGIYNNSYEDTSLYLVKEKPIDSVLSYSYGVVTGYNKQLLLPLITLNVVYKSNIMTITRGLEDFVIMWSIKLQ